MCGSWEGAEPGRQPKLPSGDTLPQMPCAGYEQGDGGGTGIGSALYRGFDSSLVQEYELFREFHKNRKFWVL